MDLSIPEGVRDFAAAAAKALADTDADDPDALLRVVRTLGIEDLDCLGSLDEALAAAHLAAAVGRVGGCLPTAALAVGATSRAASLVTAVGARDAGRGTATVDHLDLGESHAVVTPDGATRAIAATLQGPGAAPLVPHASLVQLGEEHRAGDPRWWALYVVLSAFTAAGALDAGLSLTIDYVKQRSQFGRRLADFQAVQHHLADAAVAHQGLWEMAHFALTSVSADAPSYRADALALRVSHIEAVDAALRHLHQATGAMGFTTEYPLSRLSISVQFDRYVPLTIDETLDELSARLADLTFLYPLASVGHRAPPQDWTRTPA